MSDFIVTGTASGCFTAATGIYMMEYGFNPVVALLGALGVVVFMMNIAGMVKWYDEGMEVER